MRLLKTEEQLRTEALNAAWNALTRIDDVSPEVLQAAIDAHNKVYAAAEEAYIEDQVAQARMIGWNIAEGQGPDVVMARETAVHLAQAAATYLECNGAENYVEELVWDEKRENRYTITFQRPGKKTPHELRVEADQRAQAAEDRFEKLRWYVERMENCLGELPADQRGIVMRDEGCGRCSIDHRGEIRYGLGLPDDLRN